MNRPIKFRGVSLDTGEFVYGDLQTHFRTDGKTKSFVIRTWERLDDWVAVAPDKSVTVAEYHERPVEPDSIAQLVGYDSAGNEVYEGDTFVVPCGTKIAARFFDNLTVNSKLKE